MANVVHLSFDSPGEQYSFGISLFPAGEESCLVLETPSLGHKDIPHANCLIVLLLIIAVTAKHLFFNLIRLLKTATIILFGRKDIL